MIDRIRPGQNGSYLPLPVFRWSEGDHDRVKVAKAAQYRQVAFS